jgi:TRAP-type C4-dicarboxylate transport system permease large subunit
LTYLIISLIMLVLYAFVVGIFHKRIGMENGDDIAAIGATGVVVTIFWPVVVPVIILGIIGYLIFTLGTKVGNVVDKEPKK